MTDPIAIILAGGTSSRMGSDKADYPVAGRPMIDWVIEAATQALGNVVVVGKRDIGRGVDCLPDAGGNHRGPLSGIVTALGTLKAPVVALAVDQPMVRVETIESIAAFGEQGLAAIPLDGTREQVTCARFPLEWLDSAQAELNRNGNIRDLARATDFARIEETTWRTWGEDGRSWFSIDEPGDIIVAEQRFRLNLH